MTTTSIEMERRILTALNDYYRARRELELIGEQLDRLQWPSFNRIRDKIREITESQSRPVN